jgi:hypothetical protein
MEDKGAAPAKVSARSGALLIVALPGVVWKVRLNMRKLITLLVGTLMLGGVAQAKQQDPEAQLAQALRDRVAGEPVQCIDLHRIHSSRIIDGTAILYDAGSVIYVNRPANGAEELTQWDTMVTRTSTSQLCNVDTVTMIDQGSQSFSGVVFLGDFVPYRRVRAAADQ